MTYIITPYGSAYPIDNNACFEVHIHECYCVVDMTRFYELLQWIPISPRFEFKDYKDDDDDDDGIEAAHYEAGKWLEDLLIRLHDNPIVIHCTRDGEMFIK